MNVPVSRYSGERVWKDAARVMLYTCEICGAPASCGVDAHVLQALKSKNVNLAGKWYCAPHAPADYWPSGVSPYAEKS